MKKFTSISLIFMIIFSNFTYGVTAAVTEGVKNDVLNSEYVVIVNTSSKESQSTGKIVFDENNNNTRIGQEINSQSENINEDLIINQLKNENTESEEIKQIQKAKNNTYSIGEQKNIGNNTYTLIGIGGKSYIWMENNLKSSYDNVQGKTELAAKEMIRVYEGRPYEFLNELSDNNIPYLDGSGKLSIFLEVTDNNSTGYYNNEKDIT